ncbi:mesothelin-like protein [Dryobates pubescens]|uniref:mesothelin-like protein n=1 Tax=Dryobates pubescens TaxID=118200 RepID=UPI0023B91B43|nr:mesothelin-like protein [Dryobates pubescens]
MVQAALAPAAITLCFCLSLGLVKAAVVSVPPLRVGPGSAKTSRLVPGAAELPRSPQSSSAGNRIHFLPPGPLLPAVPCLPASDLPAAAILAFARGLQNNSVELSSAQLSCLARLLAARNLTKEFQGLPPDLLLFFDSAEVRGETCKEFYTRASRGRLDLLPRGSARRSGLLRRALTCLGVRSRHLNRQQLSSLGALVCDMEPETIAASDPGVLENLKLCSALTEPQRAALNTVLLAGDTEYGDPSSWDLQALQRLGPLLPALDQSTLSLVAKEAREALGRSIMATYRSQGRSQRQRSLLLLRALEAAAAPSRPRRKRNAGSCPSVLITSNTVSDPFLLTNYWDSEEFELCLTNQVLAADLAQLLQQPLPLEFLMVVKRRLQQMYPEGIPDGQLKVLGELSRLYSPEEISQWQLTSNGTLLALLNPSDSPWEAPQLQQLLRRYLALGGSWSGALLRAVAGESLCQLPAELLLPIPPEALRTAGQLNISSCSQALKEQLYSKAQEAFAGHTNSTRAYYCLIRPYLGGAPAEDLKALAEAGTAIDMDMDTFLALNPAALERLSVMDVKRLLGSNLQALKEAENEPLVMNWVKKQLQRELDEVLGIGLQGGILQPTPAGTTTTPHPNPTASITPEPTALSSHPPPAPSTAPTQVSSPPGTLLHTTASPSTASPSAVPPPALTQEPSSSSPPDPALTTHPPSTPPVSTSPPAPGGTPPAPATQNTTPPSTHSLPEPPPDLPEPPRPTPPGYVNLKPLPGSGSMLSSCLLAMLTTALGSSLLPQLL